MIESPAGVGYSYCAASLSGGNCSNTDKSTARANRAAVQAFFGKFPELAGLDFYITGESYAGVYLPTLAAELLDNAPEVPRLIPQIKTEGVLPISHKEKLSDGSSSRAR